MLQYHFNWKVLSAAAGITWWTFYFRLYPDTIRAAEAVDFLGRLLRHLSGKLLVVWDRSKVQRSRLVGEFVASQQGRLALDYLPAYAPELNPVETSGATGNITNCPTSVPTTSPSSAIRPAAHCAACAGAHD